MFIHETAEVSSKSTIKEDVKIWNNAQIREGAIIGEHTIISKNVYIDFGVFIGKNCKIQNNVSIYNGVTLEDGVFVGPHVCFTNDKSPRAINPDGSIKSLDDWERSPITICKGASLGAHSVILPGVRVGKFAMIGAGSVVTKNVEDHTLVLGNPARDVSKVCACGKKIPLESKKIICEKCRILKEGNS